MPKWELGVKFTSRSNVFRPPKSYAFLHKTAKAQQQQEKGRKCRKYFCSEKSNIRGEKGKRIGI